MNKKPYKKFEPTGYWEGDLPKETLELLNKPRYTIKSIKTVNEDITYRKLNSWDDGGLISPFRETEHTGWRKLSIVELVKLFIIADLKELGFENSEIIDVIKLLSHPNLENEKKYPLEIAIDEGFFGHPSLLVIVNKKTPVFLNEGENWNNSNTLKEAYSSLSIILPFKKYVNKVIELVETQTLNEDDPAIPDLDKYLIQAQEKKILEILKNENFDEVEIAKANSKKERLIRAITHKTGVITDKEFETVSEPEKHVTIYPVIHEGKITGYTRNKTFKV